jgi:hypothetical protein
MIVLETIALLHVANAVVAAVVRAQVEAAVD